MQNMTNRALDTKDLLVQFRDKMELPEKHNIQIQYIA